MVNTRRLVRAFYATLLSAFVLFFQDVGEALGGHPMNGWPELHIWEILIVGILIAAVVTLGNEIRKMQQVNERLEQRVDATSSAFADIINAHYQLWGLSNAERDVTALLLKGCTIAEIAEIRGTSEGTVKAQSNKIYQKSGYENRSQLFSGIIEELTDGASLSKEVGGAAPVPHPGRKAKT